MTTWIATDSICRCEQSSNTFSMRLWLTLSWLPERDPSICPPRCQKPSSRRQISWPAFVGSYQLVPTDCCRRVPRAIDRAYSLDAGAEFVPCWSRMARHQICAHATHFHLGLAARLTCIIFSWCVNCTAIALPANGHQRCGGPQAGRDVHRSGETWPPCSPLVPAVSCARCRQCRERREMSAGPCCVWQSAARGCGTLHLDLG
jgi:hypothetical protein